MMRREARGETRGEARRGEARGEASRGEEGFAFPSMFLLVSVPKLALLSY